MEENFSKADLAVFAERGISVEIIASQFHFFQNGIPKIKLDRPAKINDGILSLSEKQARTYATVFDAQKDNFKLLKFVPASGAASRMFKFLSQFLNDFKVGRDAIVECTERDNDTDLALFFASIDKFPFYKTVLKITKQAFIDYDNCDLDTKNYAFVKTMLSKHYFDFANQPKGILFFHTYGTTFTTAIEEHCKECINYATANKKSYLHFTISQEHQNSFEKLITNFKKKSNHNTEIEVSYSYQNKSTDVLAYDLQNNPFREIDGTLVFRPGGHGALIENLNNLDADVIFIKNIDNVSQNDSETITLYKKVLSGILLEYQTTIFSYLKILKSNEISVAFLEEIEIFFKNKMFHATDVNFSNFPTDKKIDYFINALNRPIRVCGMVKNEGEPGGGPFWVSNSNGNLTLQIIEAPQVDRTNNIQIEISENATHFNPVDLVCGTKDYEGNKFNLFNYIDYSTGFIVEKAKNGVPFRAFELPGLWNGAMAHWLTIFVEVPIVTFNPVKTVNDLLKPAHQAMN